jgi:hypothetical protein
LFTLTACWQLITSQESTFIVAEIGKSAISDLNVEGVPIADIPSMLKRQIEILGMAAAVSILYSLACVAATSAVTIAQPVPIRSFY